MLNGNTQRTPYNLQTRLTKRRKLGLRASTIPPCYLRHLRGTHPIPENGFCVHAEDRKLHLVRGEADPVHVLLHSRTAGHSVPLLGQRRVQHHDDLHLALLGSAQIAETLHGAEGNSGLYRVTQS